MELHAEPGTPEEAAEEVLLEELREAWPLFSRAEQFEGWRLLERAEAEELFFERPAVDQIHLLLSLPASQRRSWIRLLPPDDAADLVQAADADDKEGLLALLDEPTRKEVTALLAYAEDDAGGLMNPRYARLRPEMSVDEAISYLRKQARERVETIYYAYVLDPEQKLQGVVSFRDLFAAQSNQLVRDVMHTDITVAPESMDQEGVGRLIAQYDLMAIPVVDAEGRMKGIVTVDDIVDVVAEAATEDIQKLGGTSALGEPYLQIRFLDMFRKRAGWLSILLVSEMLTTSAMAHFGAEIAAAVVLSWFVPLIISSGGNSGSQATSLVIRAMALGELRLRDWWRVVRRELASGVALGSLLGIIGFIRIMIWQILFHQYGDHYFLVALTISTSLVGVVTMGTLAGAVLPFLLKALKFDPASASAPFVATLVDVGGIVIYFTVASIILRGSLL